VSVRDARGQRCLLSAPLQSRQSGSGGAGGGAGAGDDSVGDGGNSGNGSAGNDGAGGGGAGDGGGDIPAVLPMPAYDVVEAQFKDLGLRIFQAAKEPAYGFWTGASGVKIMQSVFTEPRFYVGVEDYLYLWLHMASKSMCEAVVEGMGGVWDRVATDRRNVGFDTGVKESVLAWNAPQPYHASAEAFIARSLDHLFGGAGKWKTHFTHNDRHHIERSLGQGVVANRKVKGAATRLSAQHFM